jgi:hypothetical protein
VGAACSLLAYAVPIAATATAADEGMSCQASTTPQGPLSLTTGLGPDRAHAIVADQGEGTILSGSLTASAAGIPGAFLCVYSRVLTDSEISLVGIAVTRPDGTYRFAVPPGPSRNLTVVVQSPQGPQSTKAVFKTQVRPSLQVQPNPAHNKHFVRFSGRIPGPHNDRVTVVLQASGGGHRWFDFRHASTRDGGRFTMRYFFDRTTQATTYVIRAQVLGAPGYPYEGGNSRELLLRVLPLR